MADILRSSIDFGGQQAGITPDFDFENMSSKIYSPQIGQPEHGSNDDWMSTTGEMDDGFVASISEYMRDNPGASYEDAMKYMSQFSDEWAEKLLDYYMSQDSIRKANEYNASREDTAYQRLVEDLKKAGLNPALMYGNSASPVSSASSGVYAPDSGSASGRRISDLEKLKTLLLNSVLAQWQIQYQNTSNWLKGISSIGSLVLKVLGLGAK